MSFVFFFHHIIEIFSHMPSVKSVNNSKKNRRNQKRHSAPPATTTTQTKKSRHRSLFQTPITTATPENGTNGNQSDEYETPKKVEIFFNLNTWFLVLFNRILRNVQEQLDHFEMHLVNYVFFAQILHVIVVYRDKVNYFVNGNYRKIL
jgi:hypothetical protein